MRERCSRPKSHSRGLGFDPPRLHQVNESAAQRCAAFLFSAQRSKTGCGTVVLVGLVADFRTSEPASMLKMFESFVVIVLEHLLLGDGGVAISFACLCASLAAT